MKGQLGILVKERIADLSFMHKNLSKYLNKEQLSKAINERIIEDNSIIYTEERKTSINEYIQNL